MCEVRPRRDLDQQLLEPFHAASADRHLGDDFVVGIRVQLLMRDGVLCLRLPSGRELKYPSPTLKPGRFGQQQVT